MTPQRPVILALVAFMLLAACAPTASAPSADATAQPASRTCASDPIPVVAVADFDHTASGGELTVAGVEEAASARLITLLKSSGCYDVVERSELLTIMQRQGMESLDPVELARAAGAGYVVTGTVTRATIARPGASVFGFTVGATTAQVEIDVRATDIITGQVVVSRTGSGQASNPNIATNRIPAGTISFNDPTVGPLLAEAANAAVEQVVAAIRNTF